MNDETDTQLVEELIQEDPNIFLLNNLLLTVQFFENYERDVEILRENWFKEISLRSHHKKCFYADSLFRESGAKVKFSTFHRINKKSDEFLHPLRIYISSDNVEAAFDPALLGRTKREGWPQYQFTVKMDESDEKCGSASLILFKILESPKNISDSAMFVNDHFNSKYSQGKFSSDSKCESCQNSSCHNKERYVKVKERKISSKRFNETIDGTLPANGFYCFATPEESLHYISLVKYRMNTIPRSDHEIPHLCFQKEAVKLNPGTLRRIPAAKFSRGRKILNSAAFKGHFCDLLMEKLAEPLGFDEDDVHAGTIHEEFAVLGQKMKIHITHVIEITDWNNFISLTEHRHNGKLKTGIVWPTNQMWDIMNILPCYAVPYGLPDMSGKNLDHEKKWKIAFPKTEEFLLLHMMHSQIRCYFFVLSIYKSFIEPEINSASLGPKHLLHLLFWQVHKNFLSWPEERPAETLLDYLKVLYKKLQNKILRDFFINSRNLFASSFAKDLHKAQVLIKIILQNPVPYVLRAITNLKPETDFYPTFESVKIRAILSPTGGTKRRSKRFKEEKKVEERKVNVCLKNIEESEETGKESAYSADLKDMVNFDFRDSRKLSQVLEIFILHYLEMGNVSIQFKFVTQSFIYLFQSQSLFKLLSNENLSKQDLKELGPKINKLKERCEKLEREEKLKETILSDIKPFPAHPRKKLKSQQQMFGTKNDMSQKQQKIYEKKSQKIKVLKNLNFPTQPTDETNDWETKL